VDARTELISFESKGAVVDLSVQQEKVDTGHSGASVAATEGVREYFAGTSGIDREKEKKKINECEKRPCCNHRLAVWDDDSFSDRPDRTRVRNLWW
jgi:hypothetical protein